MTEERLAELMVKTVDGIAQPAEKEELMAHIADKPDLYRDYETQMALKMTTDGWVERLALDAVQDAHEAQTLSTVERGLGSTLVLLGFSILIGGAMYTAVIDSDAPLFLRIGFPLLGTCSLLLLGSAVRWKLTTGKSDKYTEIKR